MQECRQGAQATSGIVSWLERNGYDEAAGSLREGMEETLTVVKLRAARLTSPVSCHDERH